MFEGILDAYILIYVIIAGGITELIMRQTPEKISRKLFAIPVVLVCALGAAITDGLTRGFPWSQIAFRGLLATALTATLYDSIKGLLSVFLKKVSE